MKLLATRKTDQNRAVIDPWTLVHFSAGLAAGLVRIPLRWTLPAAIAYELFEQYLERKKVGQEMFETSGPESIRNAVVDIAVLAAGQRLGEIWNET
ncbi:MAG: hypothetical protein ABFS34_08735 [Gemmatimonadota bacterium]